MSYFTFKKTDKPAFFISGGKNDGRIVYIGNDSDNNVGCDKCCDDCSELCTRKKCCFRCEYAKGGCGSCGMEDEYGGFFKKQLDKIVNNKMMNIELKDGGKIFTIPCDWSHLFITGPTGSGKSTFAAKYAKLYKRLYPERKVYLFSDIDKDEPLDKIKVKRVILDERMYEEPLDKKLFKDSLVIFDDIDNIKNKKIRDATRDFRDELLNNGRHNKTSVLSLNHNAMSNQHTKASLSETKALVLFLNAGDDYRLKNVLEKYCSFDKKEIKDILKLKSRYIYVHKHFPKYILTENSAHIMK